MKSWKNGGACETKPPAWRLAANCRGKLGFSSFSRPPLSQTAPIRTRTHTMPFTGLTPLTGWRVSQSYTHQGTRGMVHQNLHAYKCGLKGRFRMSQPLRRSASLAKTRRIKKGESHMSDRGGREDDPRWHEPPRRTGGSRHDREAP